LIDFNVLDTRQYRSDQPNGDGRKPINDSVLNPDTSMLGKQQEAWLFDRLVASQTTWNVLAQQVMMARVDREPGPQALYSMDQWSGYEAARNRLLHFLDSRDVTNPVILTGDIHTNWVNDLKVNFSESNGPTIATEFVGTSISSGGNGTQTRPETDAMLAENPFVKFFNSERGYVSCQVTPEEWKTDYQVVEYVDRRGAPLVTRASFVVKAGTAGAERL
jgi:alkaline phosphatase D